MGVEWYKNIRDLATAITVMSWSQSESPIMSEDEVLKFWFEEIAPEQWWQKSAELDSEIERRFARVHRAAARCELYEWRGTPDGRLAEIIVLDQFSRNIYRDTPMSFAFDPTALALAQEAVRQGADAAVEPARRCFLYMPYMHSESRKIHEIAVELFADLGLGSNLDFELRHKAIIDRFGRYPHRNGILSRSSTPEEAAFLEQPGSSF